ncbi:sulfurtransferase [Paenibacillus antri]|uniref:Sulfurtransferase n=1 Tax=Paenibacillus antri TaxID=2582848 RepID=A0A5R9GAD0_9BACL|nr:sulfurtransferase [Paenibacillus antri]TLS49673.1 sulfurtransferase [Paenibacillus antri]
MRHIVSLEKAYAKWKDRGAVFVDCRFALGQPQSGADAYVTEHIPGAFYLDLEKDLSAPKREDGAGGRHPLPDVDELADKLSRIGITKGRCVVAYDDQGGAMASRLWWLLAYMGHDEACILDGGFASWKQAGHPTASGAEETPTVDTRFVPQVRRDWLVTAEDIAAKREKIESGKVVLLDSREDSRYRGIAEPIDKVAGHIPGARHLFWKANLDAEGRYRSVKEQMKRFEPYQGAEEIIVYCGSGVTACPNVLALREVGFTNVKLYAGSWSDWISDASRPVVMGEK